MGVIPSKGATSCDPYEFERTAEARNALPNPNSKRINEPHSAPLARSLPPTPPKTKRLTVPAAARPAFVVVPTLTSPPLHPLVEHHPGNHGNHPYTPPAPPPCGSCRNEISEEDKVFADANEYYVTIDANSCAHGMVARKAPETLVSEQPIDKQQDHRMSSDKNPVRLEDHYERGHELGVGAFGLVFVGIHRASQKRHAIKRIDRSKMFWTDRDALEDEINNLKLVRQGPHIVQLYEVYEEQSICYLVTELLPGGELFHRILQKKTFKEREARDACLCVLRALEYMHQRRVTHRDLKPENLLLRSLESDTDLKLADFGFSKILLRRNGCRTLCGTPGYLAPEILERWPAYDVKCDLWSVGVILFFMLGGYSPFDDEDENLVFENTRNGKYEFAPNLWSHVSSSAKHLVTRMLTVNPAQRISSSAALSHEWMINTDKKLDEKELNITKLRESVVKGQARALEQADRVKLLNDGFNLYLKKKKEDSFLSVLPDPFGASPPQPRDDNAMGLPFCSCYDRGEQLGEGGFAIVFRAIHKRTKESFAVKDITTCKLEDRSSLALQDEINALKLLRGGPHIVRLFDVFEEPDHTYLVMEEMKGGELFFRIVEKEVYTEREARKVCKILFEAVDFMHNKKIAHRDLKPENLLLVTKGDDTSIKIADFGFAKRVTRPYCLSTLCGTAQYIAPEILELQGYDHRADMWSVGVIVYILLGGEAPFEGPEEELAELIMKGAFQFPEEFWGCISTAAKDLIRSMLKVDPDKRISAQTALQSDWMIIDEEMLACKDLSGAQTAMKKLLPGGKLRRMVKAILASNKLCSLPKGFVRGFCQEDEKAERFGQKSNQAARTLASNSSSNVPFDVLYEEGGKLGESRFSVMHEATHRQTGVRYAVKRVPRKHLNPIDAVALQDEIKSLRVVAECPQIVHLFDVFEEPDFAYLVLEKTEGGDLIDRIIDLSRYTEKDAKQVAIKLLQAIEFCHVRGIANRNLNPDGIRLVTLDDDTNVKLCDFGCAKRVLFPNSLRTQCGTEGYVAPEILEHRPAYDVNCDMWSFGVLMFIVLGGYRPFNGDPDEVMKQIRYGDYDFPTTYWGQVSEEAKDLISRMLTVDPLERISAHDALKSPWILADDEILGRNNLGLALEELKTFKPKAKLRGAVRMIMATNKLQCLGEGCEAFEDF